ncbi:MAG: asparagine synthase (glutamine-hydrolyzing) [Acidobacteria bacterium RIFCSPLOWO2_12_FULL_67_14b]|nr:MAG: asparagine synthase (glutamine-hydrolyzing) [Acidobacteria bacterium RIFCSPLOWO2_12_FULL_67_14b]
MCGICGELSFSDDRPVSEPALEAMTATLQHRGPDHGAIYRSDEGTAGFGFRRLSIIDLRAAANQPIGNEDGSVQLVFNGEVYNFQELRRGLVANGHQFRSNADSEVIVHLYEELGDRAIDKLDGMFALAIWDHRRRRLLLARDRAGKKPLFMWRDHTRVVFASEPKALLAHPELAIDIDEEAIPYYFLHGYVPHPQTLYRGVRHVLPGTVVTFDRRGIETTRRFWQLTFPASAQVPSSSRRQVALKVRELVTAAVERRLVSDVPLGAFLSGGLDSTIIVGVMSRLMREPVRTFSIGFEGDEAFDETAIARDTARHFGTRHTEFRVRPSALDLIDTLVRHHDGPFADSSAIPTYVVSELTREHVTVALTGDGGDEVFAGYLRFGAALAAERVPGWVAALGGGVLAALPTPGNERHWITRGRRFVKAARLPLQDRLAFLTGAFYDDLEELLDPGFAARLAPVDRGRHFQGLGGVDGASPLSRLLATNFHSYLHDDLLVKADRMSMANSLEARAPFLDRELMEYVAALPDDYKLHGQTTKAILREAFDDLVPEPVKRGTKKGFGVPLDAWFRGELAGYMRDTLLAPSARLRAYVSQPYVRRLAEEHAAGRANHGHRLWTLLTFERWLALLPGWRPR